MELNLSFSYLFLLFPPPPANLMVLLRVASLTFGRILVLQAVP